MLETDGPGGAELMLYQLAIELRRRGHRVTPVGPLEGEGWLSAMLAAAGFERRTFQLKRALDPGALRSMTSMLRALDVDAVHSHEFTMAVYGCAAARWLGARHVITMHGDQGVTAAWRRRAALRWAFRRSAAAVTVSAHTRAAMADRLGIAPERLGVVHNGVPVKTGVSGLVRHTLGIGEDELLVLSVGSLRPNKGHHLLIDAFAVLAQEDLPCRVRIVIAGQGPELGALSKRARGLGLADRVHLLGQRDDIHDLHAAADIFAMPSFSEGLPLALLEAMLGDDAIVASRVGGIPEAVEDERQALLVPPGEVGALAAALRRLVCDEALRRKLASAARARAQAEFRVETMADRYEKLYRGPDGA